MLAVGKGRVTETGGSQVREGKVKRGDLTNYGNHPAFPVTPRDKSTDHRALMQVSGESSVERQ